MRHTLRETWSGLRRNMSMTFSVIVTMWVSLALFGASLMTIAEVDELKGEWYDRIEISVFLCNQDSAASGVGGNCVEGGGVADDQREAIRTALESDPNVETIYYQTKQEAYDEFQTTYGDNPVKDTLTVEQMQESFRVKLKDPQNYRGLGAGRGAERPGPAPDPRPLLPRHQRPQMGHDGHRLRAPAGRHPADRQLDPHVDIHPAP